MALPTAARAQGSSIAGVVKDASGGVLPGATVEVASDVLIEGTKSTTTDGAGQYKVVDLRPGIYAVTFSLTGFASVKQTGIEVQAESTATVNGELKVGALEETITVSARQTLVDVQSAARVQVLNKEAVENIPTSRTIQTMGQLIVGVTISAGAPDVGGSNAAMQTYMSVRGIPSAQNTVMVDGMVVNGLEGNGAIQAYFNDAAAEQVVYQTSDTTAANSGGGVQVNMIARAGGNRFSGDSQAVYRPGELQGDNLGRLKAMGVANPPGNVFISDLTVSEGGPIKRNKLWFFTTARDNQVNNYVLDTFFDDGKRGYNAEYIRDVLGRVTWQVNPSGKLQGYYDRVFKHRSHAMGALDDPETAAAEWKSPNYSTGSLKYTWTASNKLFIEGGYSFNVEIRDVISTGGIIERQLDDVSRRSSPDYQTNAWYANSRRLTTSGAQDTSAAASLSQTWPRRSNYQAAMTYVTGSHNIRAGFGWERGEFYHSSDSHADITARNYDTFIQDPVTHNFTFVTPLSVTIANTPRQSQETMNANLGVYAQDQWTMKRLTLNYGLRWEYINSKVDLMTAPAGRFVPARTQIEVLDRPNWKDWAPRFSLVYDLFGNQKTAIKYSINRYNTAETTGLAEDFNALRPDTSTRQWTDLNGDGIPQGERIWFPDGTYKDCVYQTPGCEIYLSGPSGVNPQTGLPQSLAALSGNFGLPGALADYLGNPRLWRLEHGLEIQHELLPRLGVMFGWAHWDRFNNATTVNKFRQAKEIDYQAFQFFNPIDGTPLPYLYYDITAAANARQSADSANVSVLDPDRKQFYDSYQAEFRARPWAGAQIFGGITFERTREISCSEQVGGYFVSPNNKRFCDQTDLLGDGSGITEPFAKHFKLNFSFPMGWGFVFSAAYQNLDLSGFTRTFVYGRQTQRYPNGTITYRDALGRILPATPCPAGQATCAVPGGLSAPSTMVATNTGQAGLPLDIPGLNREERLNQLDIKASKRFSMGRLRVAPTFEVFNVLNADTVLSRTVTYANTAGTFLRPTGVLKPRTIGFGFQVRW
jgi:hypothetical protein